MFEHDALQPVDEFNQQLADNVHPADWRNPEPAGRYNLVVIGAGTAGLVTAAGAAGLGARVALIERDLMGGDCLNVGCVPSKAMISAARAMAAVRDADRFGVHVPVGAKLDFSTVMERMRRLRSTISHHDSARRFTNLGVDVFFGQAAFSGPDSVTVGSQTLRFRKAVVATGARAAVPPIPGIGETGVLTNENLFSLTRLPERLVVVGGGPIGCELAQAFARFGADVTMVEMGDRLLAREDAEAAAIVQSALQRDGVQVHLQAQATQMGHSDAGKVIAIQSPTGNQDLVADAVLVSVGRQPNVENLGLEQVGVEFDLRHGIRVNDRLQSTNPRIYAAGDVCSVYKFTHAADFMARIVIQNALFLGRRRLSALTIPRATYTSPELAQVGLTAADALQQGIAIDTFKQEMTHVDRAVLDGCDQGFVKIHVKKGTDRILGATIVSENAGDLIGSLSMAMTNRIGLGKVANSIHPYPTRAEAIRKVGDLYNRTRLTPFLQSLFEKWLSWTR